MDVRSWRSPLVFLFLFAACSHKPVTSAHEDTNIREIALKRAVAELEAKDVRGPAESGLDVLNLKFESFRKLSPGRFQIFVFPYITNTTTKAQIEIQPELGRPQAFEVSIPGVSSCQTFINGKFHANLKAKEIFVDPSLTHPSRQCAFIEFTDLRLKNINKALIRRDDMKLYRLFIDDRWQVHGYDIEIYEDSRNTFSKRLKTDPNQPSTSGLTMFPVDLPVLARKNLNPAQVLDAKKVGVDDLAANQIRRKFLKNYSPETCEGVPFEYADAFGSRVEVGWCKGTSWPMYTKTNRFLAITQKLESR